MRLERLILEAGEHSYALDFHRRLTVVAGLETLDRDGLINELVGALGGGRHGVHLELVSDTGSRFAIFRPTGAVHRIVAVDSALDVTSQFHDELGEVNLLAQASLDTTTARQAMTLLPEDLESASDHDRLVRRLATVNQSELWISAENLRSAQVRLQTETEANESVIGEARAPEEIEHLHEAHQTHRERFERLRKLFYVASGCAGLLAVPVLTFIGIGAALAISVLVIVGLAATLATWRRALTAEHAEKEALARFDAESYLGFQLQRVNGLLDSDRGRRGLMRTAEEHREALRRWDRASGGLDLAWVFRHRDEIDRASRLRSEVFGGEADLDSETYEQAAAFAHGVVGRLGDLRSVGRSEENFTAILNDPFRNLDPAAIPPLLELLVRSSEHQQILLLTECDAIAAWARLESMTGVLSLIEPTAPQIDATPTTADSVNSVNDH